MNKKEIMNERKEVAAKILNPDQKCIVVLLDDNGDSYKVRMLSLGINRLEVIAILENQADAIKEGIAKKLQEFLKD